MEPLPFTLPVPGRDTLTLRAIGSTSYRFRGLLHLRPEAVELEWTGIARVDEVGWTGVRSERLALPLESVVLPLAALRTIRLAGGWLRPCLELTGTTLSILRSVPGEEAGRVRLRIARRDRPLARRLLVALGKSPRLPDRPDQPAARQVRPGDRNPAEEP